MKMVKSRHRLLLTGTPIQNNLHEMWSLYDYTCPGEEGEREGCFFFFFVSFNFLCVMNLGLLGTSRDFKREFENPIKAGSSSPPSSSLPPFSSPPPSFLSLLGSHKKATPREVELGRELATQLRQVIAPHFLRREKAEVFKTGREGTPVKEGGKEGEDKENGGEGNGVCTPTSGRRRKKTPGKSGGKKKKKMLSLDCHKNDFIVWVKLTETQRSLYRDFLGSDLVKTTLNSSKSPLAAITVLKKICNHPLLLHRQMTSLGGVALPSYLPASFDSSFLGRQEEEGASSSTGDENGNSPPSHKTKQEEYDFLLSLSGKLGFLARLLLQLKKEGQRPVVFSSSVRTLDMINAVLKHLGLSCLRIDGSVKKPSERQERIDHFNQNPEDYFCFLLTTQVGKGKRKRGSFFFFFEKFCLIFSF